MAAYVYRGETGKGFEPGETYHLAHPPVGPGWELATESKKKTEVLAPEVPEETQ